MCTTAQGRYGLLHFILCCFFALLPCFICGGWQISPLLTIWAVGAGVRWHHKDRQFTTDCVMFGIMSTIVARGALKNIISNLWGDSDLAVVATPWFLISCFVIPFTMLAYLYRRQTSHKRTSPKPLPTDVSARSLQYPKAKIFPCQIKHARMFPKRHAFEYSYLQCGFPIIPAEARADGTETGSSDDSQLGCWWLQVNAGDYLSRGNDALGFYNKLKIYLQEQVCICRQSRARLTSRVLMLAACG
jgi:hypothetical protein